MVHHDFTNTIISETEKMLRLDGKEILQASPLMEYINIKTKSANRGSKARGSFANLYAIYVLVEDYIRVVYDSGREYKDYEGAVFSDLFARQRELPFGEKLQNHALNHRLNEEFHKYFPTISETIIIRNLQTSRYWVNRSLLNVKINGKQYDISKVIISIINEYIKAKQSKAPLKNSSTLARDSKNCLQRTRKACSLSSQACSNQTLTPDYLKLSVLQFLNIFTGTKRCSGDMIE